MIKYLALFFCVLMLPLDNTSAVTCNGSANPCDAASASYADVNAAVALTPRGGTLRVPAGSANWGTNMLVLDKGIHLVGAGRNHTYISGTNDTDNTGVIKIAPDATAITNGETFEVIGFDFSGPAVYGGSTSNGLIQIDGKYNCQIRVMWNRFHDTNTNQRAIYKNGLSNTLIADNIFDRCNAILYTSGNGSLVDAWYHRFPPVSPLYFPTPFPGMVATVTFFERNTIGWSSHYEGSAPGWMESSFAALVVYRYNTWNFSNTAYSVDHSQALLQVIDAHGFQGWRSGGAPAEGNPGTVLVEAYGNTITNYTGSVLIFHRGSYGMFHNNIGSGGGSMQVQAQQYGPLSGPSGCQNDVEAAIAAFPGDYQDTAAPFGLITLPLNFSTLINKTYTFNVKVNGSNIGMGHGTAYECGIAEGTNYFNEVGVDTSATITKGTSTPTGSCTQGHGYWKASTTSATTDPAVIQNGTFYICPASGLWSGAETYTPATYPATGSIDDPEGGSPTPTPTPTPTATPTPSGTPILYLFKS